MNPIKFLLTLTLSGLSTLTGRPLQTCQAAKPLTGSKNLKPKT